MLKECHIIQTETTFELFAEESEARKFFNTVTPTLWAGNIELGLDDRVNEINLENVKQEEMFELIRKALDFMWHSEETHDFIFRSDLKEDIQ